jgi:hypothetical protein
VDPERLEEQAQKARRLAASMVDQKTVDTLRNLAAEYDAQLAAMTAPPEVAQPSETEVPLDEVPRPDPAQSDPPADPPVKPPTA